ncbi:MAG: YgdI/YgdR family lipoprotein [Ruminococcus sp.]|nr:YgdI/YgdR family lipoprotein [Ruminococcus sp.]MCM1380954.1 YgdI/YgdR family lipoprotein [Muribaculaceae bacterium]MCM1479536.1 YgdI/YgdR family lipoprotein [Muribaculaceae bacterium]
MAKKILTAVLAAVMLMCAAGCSKEYVMTEEDLALQAALEGVWGADYSTGYNEYDEDGNILVLTIVEFTYDFKHMLHLYSVENGYFITYDPEDYTIENQYFKVEIDGTPNYAQISVSDDGQTLLWITEDRTDKYLRLTEEQIDGIGIPEYDPEYWAAKEASRSEAAENSESVDGDVSETVSESGTDVTESETEVSESESGTEE